MAAVERVPRSTLLDPYTIVRVGRTTQIHELRCKLEIGRQDRRRPKLYDVRTTEGPHNLSNTMKSITGSIRLC